MCIVFIYSNVRILLVCFDFHLDEIIACFHYKWSWTLLNIQKACRYGNLIAGYVEEIHLNFAFSRNILIRISLLLIWVREESKWQRLYRFESNKCLLCRTIVSNLRRSLANYLNSSLVESNEAAKEPILKVLIIKCNCFRMQRAWLHITLYYDPKRPEVRLKPYCFFYVQGISWKKIMPPKSEPNKCKSMKNAINIFFFLVSFYYF